MNGQITNILAGYGLTPNFKDSPYVPEGEQIKLSVDWQAVADGTNWTSAVVAYIPYTWEILDEQTERHISAPASGNVKLNLLNMGSSAITIAVVLWGNPNYLEPWKSFPENGGNWVQLDYKTITVQIKQQIPDTEYRNLEIVSFSPNNLHYGDKLRVNCRVQHIGEGESGKIRVAVGNRGTFGFNEVIHSEVPVTFQDRMDWNWVYLPVDVDITEAIDPGTYEIMVKLLAVTGPDLFAYSANDVVTIYGPSYEGEIVSKQLVDSATYNIPVSQSLPIDTKVKVKVVTQNTGYDSYHPNCIWEVRDPNGSLINLYNHTAFDLASPGEESAFFEAVSLFTLHLPGNYTIKIWLTAIESEEVLDYWESKLCTVVGEPAPECSMDSDCPSGYVCRDGVCVPEEEPPGPPSGEGFPLLPTVLIVGGGAAIAAALLTKKK